jgi:hypothetical protein
MTDPDNFLSRWSRKKMEDKREDAEQPEPAADAAPPQGENLETPAGEQTPGADAKPQAGAPVFDLSQLPSIDSIGAQTDISAFLQAGVPTELRHAALRRAWSLDPAIRDFRGLQENDWDFNDPTGVPGFGPLPADFDVKQMVAQLFGEKPHDDSAKPAEPDRQAASLTDESTNTNTFDAEKSVEAPASGQDTSGEPPAPSNSAIPLVAPEQSNLVQREDNIAAQDKNTEESKPTLGRPHRPHGGALPQ